MEGARGCRLEIGRCRERDGQMKQMKRESYRGRQREGDRDRGDRGRDWERKKSRGQRGREDERMNV